MKLGESMANMVSRLQSLKLVLKQPKPASVFKFLDAIRPKSLADEVKDILRVKEMDPNAWTVKDVGDIAIRLEKAQGEETLWTTTTKSVVVPSGMSSGSGFVKDTTLTCHNCGRTGHIKKRCPYKTSKPTKKAVTNARSSFANPKANRSEDRKCYMCNRPGHIARDCPQNKALGNRTTQLKGKPGCSYHKLNTHSSEACWALHPELRPSSSKEKVAHSVRPVKVAPARAGHGQNVKLRPTGFAAEKIIQPGVNQTMDSYYAEEVFDEDANDLAGLFIIDAGAATKERRSAETQGLRRVTQADLPLSFLPYSAEPAAVEEPVPDPVPTPIVAEDELGRFTPRQYRAPRVGKIYGGEDLMCEESLDATDFSYDPRNKSDREEMPESFGYLSESDPNFQGVLEFVMSAQLPESRSVSGNGSEKNKDEEKKSAMPIRTLEDSEMPQKGHPSELKDEAARQILKNLSIGEQPSLLNDKELAQDIPADVLLTRDDFSSGTRNVRKNDPPEEVAIVGEKRVDGESNSLSGQQSTFDKSMQGTTFATVVQEDPDIEPVLYSHFSERDQAPEDWTVQDRQKYHQVELQALLGGPIPADIQSIVRELGNQSSGGWVRAVSRQVFRPVPRPGFHSAIFKRKRLLGRTSYPTFLDMGLSNSESLEL
jgi:hypothetical protein